MLFAFKEVSTIATAPITTLTMTGTPLIVPARQLFRPPRRNAVRVRVKRNGVWHDLTHRVLRGQVRHNNDEPVATLDLTFLNGAQFPTLAPRVKTSPINRVNNQYMPMLDRYNEIMVEAAFSVDGDPPTYYIPVFHGLLGDDIRTEHDAEAGVVVHIEARDMAKRLQDQYIMEPITFREMYASEIIQALLDEFFGDITLNTVGVDDFYVEEVTFEYIDVWQAIQSFCEQSDKDVRYLLDETTEKILLTYWTPSTAMVPVWGIEAKDILHESLSTSDASVRHRVVVKYLDEDGMPDEVIVQDLSIKKPNEPIRTALINEAEASAIRDEEAAERFASAVLTALKTEPATDSLVMPFTPYMRVYDVIQVTNPGIRSEPELYAIEELRLNFSVNEWTTEVIASDSVKIRHERWLEKEAKQGVAEPPKSRLLAPEQVTAIPDIVDNELVIHVEWTPTTATALYQVRWRAEGDADFAKHNTEETEYTITGLPAGDALYPGPNTYPGPDTYTIPVRYEVGVLSISPFGRSSPVNSVMVDV